jgi:hypothetical protein
MIPSIGNKGPITIIHIPRHNIVTPIFDIKGKNHYKVTAP